MIIGTIPKAYERMKTIIDTISKASGGSPTIIFIFPEVYGASKRIGVHI